MLDIKFIRENQDEVKQSLLDRNLKLDLERLIAIDDQRRKKLSEVEELRARQNKANDEISALLKEKKDAKPAIAAMKEVSARIGALEEELRGIEPELNKILLVIPNIPHSSLPRGDASNNKIVSQWGKVREFDFKPVTHIDIAQKYDIIDFVRATKITGTNFVLYKGWGQSLNAR